MSHDLQMYSSNSGLAFYPLPFPLFCFRPVTIASSHIGLSERPSEDSLTRLKGQLLLLSWPSEFRAVRGKRSSQGVMCGGHKAFIGAGRCSKMTPALGVLFWSVDDFLLDLPDLAGALHQLAITNSLQLLYPVVQPQLLSAEIHLVFWQTRFWAECLFKWSQADILLMDISPSFSSGSRYLWPTTEGKCIAFQMQPLLCLPLQESSFRHHLSLVFSRMDQTSVHSVKMQERIFPFIRPEAREIQFSHAAPPLRLS